MSPRIVGLSARRETACSFADRKISALTGKERIIRIAPRNPINGGAKRNGYYNNTNADVMMTYMQRSAVRYDDMIMIMARRK